jgi:PAS domain S-box-containing protein
MRNRQRRVLYHPSYLAQQIATEFQDSSSNGSNKELREPGIAYPIPKEDGLALAARAFLKDMGRQRQHMEGQHSIVGVVETMPHPQSYTLSKLRAYGLAVSSVAVALGAALLLAAHNFRGVEFPLFLMAIALTVWYAGVGPAAVALVLSGIAFNYFFTEPFHTLYITRDDLPYYVVFLLFALLLTWFSTVRRRIERDLVESRDALQREVIIRTQQANLLNLTHDTIFVRDMNDMITYWNRGAQELYGLMADQAVGKRAHELLQTVFSISLDEIQKELLLTGRWEGELEHTKADGSSVVVASRWSLQRNGEGTPVAILETNNDITQRKRGEQEIRELNRELAKRTVELETINKELESFAYSTSHDLRAPLRHVAGYAELLQKNGVSVLDDQGKKYVRMILESAKRMGNLIDDLLAFSRIGRAETRNSRVSLNQLVREVQGEIAEEIAGRSVVWTIDDLPEFYGDRSMLKLALLNLISNAVKFTRTRPQAEIEIRRAEGPADSIVILVRDNGVGFDMKYLNKLFGVFQRLHRS